MWSREFPALRRWLGELQAQHQRAGSAAGDSLHACLETNELIPALRPFPRPPSINLPVKKCSSRSRGKFPPSRRILPGAPCADLLGSARRAEPESPAGPGSRWDSRLRSRRARAAAARDAAAPRAEMQKQISSCCRAAHKHTFVPMKDPPWHFWAKIPTSAIASCPSDALRAILTFLPASPPLELWRAGVLLSLDHKLPHAVPLPTALLLKGSRASYAWRCIRAFPTAEK